MIRALVKSKCPSFAQIWKISSIAPGNGYNFMVIDFIFVGATIPTTQWLKFGVYCPYSSVAFAFIADSISAQFLLRKMLPIPKPPFEPHATRIVIQGMTLRGRAFRPSDWAERLCGIMSTFGGDHQMRYSPYVQPVLIDGVRCVLVSPMLIDIEPRAHRFLLDFAKDNELVVIDPSMPATADYCPVPGGALEKLAF